MSSDNYFDDDDFDEAALAQVEAIEAAALSKASTSTNTHVPPPIPASRPKPRALSPDSSVDFSFDIDESELQKLDEHVAQQYCEKVLGVPGPSRRPIHRTNSNTLQQTTLFGDVLPTQSPAKPKTPGLQRTKSSAGPRNLFGQQAPKTKTWDPTFDEEEWRDRLAKKGKGKGKEKSKDERDDEVVRSERSLPVAPAGPPPPMRLKPDLLEAKHWVFPINRSKRDYQYNIVKNCLFDNTLVALPTGMGKTFVAGVVMLNYYRWFPQGKIIFVAPTRPLVAQQIVASHETCGIPGNEAIELTGTVRPPVRARYWQEKRVFYMTPQTLESDLASGACDPGDVILLVIDEAHHGTGEYSYPRLVKFITAKNPHFRVLALTATPGNNVESVQKLVDGLHISKIEMRSEKSIDLRPYIFEKVIHPHVIKPTEDVQIILDLFKAVMDPIFTPLQKAGMFGPNEHSLGIHPFRPNMILREKKHPLAVKSYTPLNQLGTLARAVMYLQTASIAACRGYLEEVVEQELESNRKNSLKDNPHFKAVVQKLEEFKQCGRSAHNKMDKLKDILVKYFGSRLQEPNETGDQESDASRVMVFSSYRAVVEEIVTELNQHRPLIRAAAFVGQASDKSGRAGLKQSEQQEMIKRFKAGEFNVLVATSIGEEGLDIGEIDCTVCYDTDKGPTRMVQRFGRTGRKRAGIVHALLAEGREEFNLEKAKGTYEEVQKFIDRGTLFELYGDVPRLLPDRVRPECVEKVMEMQHYIPEEPRKARGTGTGAKGTKRKRNADPDRNIPPDGPSTFTSASKVWNQFTKKKPRVEPLPADPEDYGDDGDTDQEIEGGLLLGGARRTQSDKPQAKRKKASSPAPAMRRSKSTAATKPKKPTAKEKKAIKKIAAMSTEELAKFAEEDEVDLEVERGTLLGGFKPASEIRNVASTSKRSASPMATYKITDTEEDEQDEDDKEEDRTPSPEVELPQPKGQDLSWLVDNDDDFGDFNGRSDFGPVRIPSPQFDRFEIEDESIEISQAIPSQRITNNKQRSKEPVKTQVARSSSPEILEVIEQGFRPASKVSFAPDPPKATKRKTNMSPPPVPTPSRTPKSPFNSVATPEATQFPVSKPKRRRVNIVPSSDDEEEDLEQPVTHHRLHRRHAESTPVRPKPKSKLPKAAKISLLDKVRNPIMDGEAAHSGDEVSEGASEDEDERSSDREFLKDSPSMTQVSPSYEQTQIYRQSLFTQAPMGANVPAFARGPLRSKPFGRIEPRRNRLPSSSPPPFDEELDEYEHGSFIVPDDGDIVMDLSSDNPILDL